MSNITAIDISAGGLEYQRMKMEAIATNIANANVPRNATGEIFSPIDVVADGGGIVGFGTSIENSITDVLHPQFVQTNSKPKQVYDPENSLANADGYLEYPNLDSTRLMLDMMETTRAYEANLKALSAERLMVMKTIEMG